MRHKIRHELLLLLAALIWGVSFVAQRAGMEHIGPFTFNGIRSLLGAAILLPLIGWRGRGQRMQKTNKLNQSTLYRAGILCGTALFVASSLQQHGIAFTSAGKAGFITSLYIVLVPILSLILGKKPRPFLWICVLLATWGLYLLSAGDGLIHINKGDLLVLASSLVFALHILLVDHFSPRVDGVKLASLQFLTCGLLSLPFMLTFESLNWQAIFKAWLPLAYAGILSCGVAYTLQIVAQKQVEPTLASLILALESTFALVAGILLLQERISPREAVGCLIMLAAISLAQLPSKSPDTEDQGSCIPC